MDDSKLDRLILNVTLEQLPRLKEAVRGQRTLMAFQVIGVALQLMGIVAIGILIWRL